jgi:hypothetical protein
VPVGFRSGTVHPVCPAKLPLEDDQQQEPVAKVPRHAVGTVQQGRQIIFRENNSPKHGCVRVTQSESHSANEARSCRRET